MGLRDGPDSYGRQQWGILHNGGNPDAVSYTHLAEKVIEIAKAKKVTIPQHKFTGSVEHAIAHIEEAALHDMPQESQRWYAVKIFERDEKLCEKLGISKEVLDHIERDIKR